jgi:hypothetical protein
MIGPEPFLCTGKIKVTTESCQVDRTMIERLGAVDYGEATVADKRAKYLADRHPNPKIGNVTQKDAVTTFLSIPSDDTPF